MIELENTFLRGSYTPVVTPFYNGEVDYDAYAELVEYQVTNGSHGIVVNGTSGEPSTLNLEEREKLVETAVKTANGRIPVVAGTGSQSHEETVRLTLHAERAGADALLIVTPYYIRPSQRGLAEYFVNVGKKTQLPMLIYHIPGRAAVSMQIDTVVHIADRLPNLVGMKHAVNDLGFASSLLKQFGPEFRIFVGLEELSFPMLAVGAAGLMNAVGNVATKDVAQLVERVANNQLQEARDLHYKLFELNQAVFWDTNPAPIKYMMKRMGLLSNNEHRLPMIPVSDEVADRLDEMLKRNGYTD